ncbi:MAG: AbrB family transcriptional regulator [Chloroflexota bacterium]|nr:AbrB family transcriptional regulator [Chloroflexota bacterium]
MRNADLHGLIDRLPEDVVRRVEKGVPVTLVVSRENGRLEMREIDPEQAWFWTPEWQEGEREADEDIAAGRVTRYDSDEEFLKHLESISLRTVSQYDGGS